MKRITLTVKKQGGNECLINLEEFRIKQIRPSTCTLLGCARGTEPSPRPPLPPPLLQGEGLLPSTASRCSEAMGCFLRMISGLW